MSKQRSVLVAMHLQHDGLLLPSRTGFRTWSSIGPEPCLTMHASACCKV